MGFDPLDESLDDYAYQSGNCDGIYCPSCEGTIDMYALDGFDSEQDNKCKQEILMECRILADQIVDELVS